MQPRPFLDYYARLRSVPTRQDTSERDRHVRRRGALYRHLGLVPAWISGKRVIEFGPGSGDNALFTMALRPKTYVLVDGCSSSIAATWARLRGRGLTRDSDVEVVERDLLGFEDARRFDLVLCEGIIPQRPNPESCLDHVASFVADGGLLVTTAVSATSFLPEICRRLVKPAFARRFPRFDDRVAALVKFFGPDLDTLPAMSRLREDWVIDSILHPWEGRFFSIAETVERLAPWFDFHGSSPRFVSDWRWYKDLDRPDCGINALACDQYRRWRPSLIDWRAEPVSFDRADSERLERACEDAHRLHTPIWKNDDYGGLPEFLAVIDDIASFLEAPMRRTSASLRDYRKGMKDLAFGNGLADFGSFTGLFGRGQQYVSLLRAGRTGVATENRARGGGTVPSRAPRASRSSAPTNT